MNRIDRLVAILIHLQGRRVTRAEEIAEEFGVSLRTVYRDIAALGEAGVPIQGEAGVGYTIVAGYHLPPVQFTKEEATALITASLLLGRFTDRSLLPAMSSALAKIRAVLPPDQKDHVGRLELRMVLPDLAAANQTAHLAALQQAIADRLALRISYRVSGALRAAPRDVEPLGLAYYDERWHLIAWCRLRQDYRDFRTDRMEKVVSLRETFVPRDDATLDQILARSWDNSTQQLRGAVELDAVAAEKFRKEATCKILAEKRSADRVNFTIEGGKWEWYLEWMISFGDRLTILDPPELRERLRQLAETTAAHHRVISGESSV